MNYLDIIIVIPLIWAAYKGFSKGFIITFLSLIALIGGIYGSLHFSAFISGYLCRWFNPKPEYMGFISFVFTFCLILAIVYLVGHLLDKFIKSIGLGIINRLAGAAFNLLKIALILSFLMNIFVFAGINWSLIPENKKKESILYSPVSKLVPGILHYYEVKNLQENGQEKEPSVKKVIVKANRY